jgi:nucleoside-diphosphate-sugar epimerase
MAKILIIGCGSIGLALAQALVANGHQVTGLKRHLPVNRQDGIDYFQADITQSTQLAHLATDFAAIFFIVTSDSREPSGYQAIYETGLNNLIQHFADCQQQPRWLLVSSTGVYGQTNGEWVDENSVAEPKSATSQWIRHAEQQITAFNANNVVVRFAGIYGPGRESLIRMAKLGSKIQKEPPYYTNRIHQDDCIGVLVFLLTKALAGHQLDNCYLASDHDPAPMWDVITWLAEQCHAPAPIAKTELATDMNKRCNNQRLVSLGYQFIYPDYKSGYQQVLAQLPR